MSLLVLLHVVNLKIEMVKRILNKISTTSLQHKRLPQPVQ